MLKLYDLECPNCHFTTEELLDFNTETGKIEEDVLCEECGTCMEVLPFRKPMYSKHGSWSAWSLGHTMGK